MHAVLNLAMMPARACRQKKKKKQKREALSVVQTAFTAASAWRDV